jgi:hypothetical protein
MRSSWGAAAAAADAGQQARPAAGGSITSEDAALSRCPIPPPPPSAPPPPTHLERMALRHLWQGGHRSTLPRHLLGGALQGGQAAGFVLHLRGAQGRDKRGTWAATARRGLDMTPDSSQAAHCIRVRGRGLPHLGQQLVGLQQLQQADVAAAQRLEQADGSHDPGNLG